MVGNSERAESLVKKSDNSEGGKWEAISSRSYRIRRGRPQLVLMGCFDTDHPSPSQCRLDDAPGDDDSNPA